MTEVAGLAKGMTDFMKSLIALRSFPRKKEIVMDIACPAAYEAWMRSRAFFVLLKRRRGEDVQPQAWGRWVTEAVEDRGRGEGVVKTRKFRKEYECRRRWRRLARSL